MLESDHQLAGGRPGYYSFAAMTGASGKSGDPRRAERLKAALRANLKRRKAQIKARGRLAGQTGEHDSAGIIPEIAPHKPKG